MPAHVLLSLLLASPPAPIPVETVRTYDLGKMTFEEAKRLDGEFVRISFSVAELAFDHRNQWIVAKGNPDVDRFVTSSEFNFLDCTKPVLAEGILQVRVVPPPGCRGNDCPARSVIEVNNAKAIRP